MSKFKVGDEVKLSAKGEKYFSRDNWTKYKVPHSMFCGDYGVVTQILEECEDGQDQIYVKNDAGCVYYYEDDIELVSEQQPNEKLQEILNFDAPKQQYTGASSDYYKIFVKNPTTLSEPYYAECNDIIEALEMDFAEGNAFKAIWRKAMARKGVKKKGYDNGVYDSEKVVFFGERMLVKAKESE